MVTLEKEFFETVRHYQTKVNTTEMWKAFDKAEAEKGYPMQDVEGNELYTTCAWYGNHGLPVLPCYEEFSSVDSNVGFGVLLMTREQYEIFCKWQENTTTDILASRKYNQYDLYVGHIDEVFVFDGENSEIIYLR